MGINSRGNVLGRGNSIWECLEVSRYSLCLENWKMLCMVDVFGGWTEEINVRNKCGVIIREL